MYSSGWRPDDVVTDSNISIKDETIKISSILSLAVFLAQYGLIIFYSMSGGKNLFNFMMCTNIIAAMLIGFVSHMSFTEIGQTIAKGINSMGFVGFIIGLAGVFSLVMQQGNVMDTIVFYLTKPLSFLGKGFSSIGVSMVVSLLNPLVPSATSKAAILIPIIRPITEALNIEAQIAVEAFQIGDGFTNLISPVLGWTMGSLAIAKVDYNKWVRWVAPVIGILLVTGWIVIYILTIVGFKGY